MTSTHIELKHAQLKQYMVILGGVANKHAHGWRQVFRSKTEDSLSPFSKNTYKLL